MNQSRIIHGRSLKQSKHAVLFCRNQNTLPLLFQDTSSSCKLQSTNCYAKVPPWSSCRRAPVWSRLNTRELSQHQGKQTNQKKKKAVNNILGKKEKKILQNDSGWLSGLRFRAEEMFLSTGSHIINIFSTPENRGLLFSSFLAPRLTPRFLSLCPDGLSFYNPNLKELLKLSFQAFLKNPGRWTL